MGGNLIYGNCPLKLRLFLSRENWLKESGNWTVEKTKEVRQNMTLAMSKEAKAYG
jgi:hypothetical protein